MSSVLEKQLARALDQRLAVFMAKAAEGSLLRDEMSCLYGQRNHYALLLYAVQQGEAGRAFVADELMRRKSRADTASGVARI